jgi:hypothetical protein
MAKKDCTGLTQKIQMKEDFLEKTAATTAY